MSTSYLSHSPAEVMQVLFEEWDRANNNSTWLGSTFVSTDPDAPDQATILNDTTGNDDGRTMADGELQQHYGLQARVRSQEYPDGWLRATAIRTWLSEQLNQALVPFPDGTSFIVWCAANIKQVLYIGRELPASDRKLFTLNFTVAIKEVT